MNTEAVESVNTEFVEKCIIKTAMESKDFLVTISNTFIPEYFDDSSASTIFTFLKNHLNKYNSLPDKEVVINCVKDKEEVSNFVKEINGLEYEIAKNYD